MPLSDKCPNCRVQLPHENGFVFCSSCKAPEFSGDLRSPFEILGVPKTFHLETAALEARYYELSKRLHPDRFSSTGGPAKIKSQELSAALNQSYQSLHEPDQRLETLLRSTGATDRSGASKDQIPADLAEKFFNIQEEAMDAAAEGRSSEGVTAVDGFVKELQAQNELLTHEMFGLAETVDWSQPDAGKLPLVGKIVGLRQKRSYIRSMLQNLESLRAKVAGKREA
jgi:molecular chaperone HscB